MYSIAFFWLAAIQVALPGSSHAEIPAKAKKIATTTGGTNATLYQLSSKSYAIFDSSGRLLDQWTFSSISSRLTFPKKGVRVTGIDSAGIPLTLWINDYKSDGLTYLHAVEEIGVLKNVGDSYVKTVTNYGDPGGTYVQQTQTGTVTSAVPISWKGKTYLYGIVSFITTIPSMNFSYRHEGGVILS
jgi:hypothetical protein